jgi:hypothetical protein
VAHKLRLSALHVNAALPPSYLHFIAQNFDVLEAETSEPPNNQHLCLKIKEENVS